MAGVPQTVDEITAFHMGGSQGDCCRRGNQTDGMAQTLVASAIKNVVGLAAVDVVLIEEGVNTFRIEEVLDAVGILLLPRAVGTRSGIVHGDIHGHTPGVITEGIANDTGAVHE